MSEEKLNLRHRIETVKRRCAEARERTLAEADALRAAEEKLHRAEAARMAERVPDAVEVAYQRGDDSVCLLELGSLGSGSTAGARWKSVMTHPIYGFLIEILRQEGLFDSLWIDHDVSGGLSQNNRLMMKL